jgi:hypothetical protein
MTCSICFDTIHDDGFTTPCNHHMHNNCLTHWLLLKNTCPICRHKLYDPTNDIEENISEDEDDDEIESIEVSFINELYSSNYNTILDSLKEIIYRLSSDNDDYVHYFNWYYDEINSIYFIKINTRNDIIKIEVYGNIYEKVLYIEVEFTITNKKNTIFTNKSLKKELYVSNYSQLKLPTKINCY